MKHIKYSLSKIGDHPGSVRYTGEREAGPAFLEHIAYDPGQADREPIPDLAAYEKRRGVDWIRLIGVQDTDTVSRIGERFGIDALVLEDIAHVGTRSKVDFYDEYTFFVFDTLYSDPDQGSANEQISVIKAKDTVITFQETDTGLFDPIVERIMENKGVVRKNNADYLLYCLIDAIVDRQFILLNDFEEKMDELEMAIINESHTRQSREIYALKRELLLIKNSVWPMRDIIGAIITEDDSLDRATRRHYRDIEDHIKQIMEFTTTYRELIMGMYETYLSNISNRMNRIITTLTVFSVIFIPLTFLAGVYGMNFQYFPELHWRWAYPAFWAVCAAIGAGMFIFFKKKRWM